MIWKHFVDSIFVVYWPTTRPGYQNRKCTYVNNRCIRSGNIRIITLTVDGLNECNYDAHKKKGALNYYITPWRQEVKSVWRPDPLVTRCGRESQHPAEWAPRPPLSSPGEWERNAVKANRVRVNMLQFCSVSNSLSHTTLSIKWEVYFSKNCVARLYCVVTMNMYLQHFKRALAHFLYTMKWIFALLSKYD